MSRSDWLLTELGDLIDIKHGHAFKGQFFKDNPPGDILLTPGNFRIGGGFKAGKLKYYDGPVPEDFVLQEGDLLVTMTDLSRSGDTLGYPAILPPQRRGRYLHNQRLGLVEIKPHAQLRKGFLYYLMTTREYRYEVLASATGTTVKHTSPKRIKSFAFQLPSIAEQDLIAHILGTLDEKIDLNREMALNLELIAQTLFKSWFVDFDPVTTQAEDRKRAGIDVDIYRPPRRLVDSELGLIPEGWNVGRASQMLKLSRDGIAPSQHPNEMFTHFSIPSLDEHESPEHELGRSIKSGKYVAPSNSVLLSKLNPQISRVWLPNIDVRHRPVASTEFLVCIPKEPFSREYLFCLFKDPAFRGKFISLITGTSKSHQRVRPTDFLSMKLVLPPKEIVKAFIRNAAPFLRKSIALREELTTLVALRDTILPRLFSGELPLGQTDESIEGVA